MPVIKTAGTGAVSFSGQEAVNYITLHYTLNYIGFPFYFATCTCTICHVLCIQCHVHVAITIIINVIQWDRLFIFCMLLKHPPLKLTCTYTY